MVCTGCGIRRHQTGIWRHLRSLGAAADEADDLLQETFVVAWLQERGVPVSKQQW